MSYILDALQRAEAERERGHVPGLHAQALPLTKPALPRSARQRAALAAIAALALGAVAGGVWMWHAPAVTVPIPTETATPAQPAPTPAPAPVAAPLPVALAPAGGLARPASGVTPAAHPATKPAVAVTNPAPGAPTAPVPAAPPASIALLADLPSELRSQIPALAISGAVYSENPAQRLLLVNGQVLGQGSTVAPDLTLDTIRPNSSEFSFRGTRFRVAH